MKLDSKTDKQIKRFLKSISESMRVSTLYNSIHYTVVRNGKEWDVRFADHFHTNMSTTKCDINIIKVRDEFYCIHYFQTQATIPCEQALNYLKAIVLIGPDISNAVSAFADAAHKASQLYQANQKSKLIKEANTKIEILNNKISDLEDLLVQADKELINLRKELVQSHQEEEKLRHYINTTVSTDNIINKFEKKLDKLRELYTQL